MKGFDLKYFLLIWVILVINFSSIKSSEARFGYCHKNSKVHYTMAEILALKKERNARSLHVSADSVVDHPLDDDERIAFYPSPKEDGTFIKIFMKHEPDPYKPGPAGAEYDLSQFYSLLKLRTPKPTNENVYFLLYTKKNPDSPVVIIPDEINSEYVLDAWNKDAPVKILCHGFQSEPVDPFPIEMKNSYLQIKDDLNVIIIDWSRVAASFFYPTVAKYTALVGELTADLAEKLIRENLTTLSNIHFIGHSLGAHVGGSFGKTLIEKKLGKVGRITGLDPAGPCFCKDLVELTVDDAEFIDIIHTDDDECLELNCLGYIKAIITDPSKANWGSVVKRGHSDFFPNGGYAQPGCTDVLLDRACSHSRAYHLMNESIRSANSSTAFRACGCSYDEFQNDNCNCSNDSLVIMGEYTPVTKTRANYFLRTGREYPYSIV